MKRSSSRSRSPSTKTSRITIPSTASPLVCTLPPTCSAHPTALESTRELEAHYAKYHAWVCQDPGCNKVFPDERFLELHQTECHDPIAAVRKERGEKIFACFLPSSVCSKTFMTPKARRLHLIAAHEYPKEYFFAVINKGVGGLLSKWGDGAGMIRGEWKSRSKEEEKQTDEERKENDDRVSESGTETEPEPREDEKQNDSSMDVDALTTSFQSSLSISPVPSSIRFGRGAKRGGRGRGWQNYYYSNSPQSYQHQYAEQNGPKRGRGGFRGRGRGFNVESN